jgi:hypothetical protein
VCLGGAAAPPGSSTSRHHRQAPEPRSQRDRRSWSANSCAPTITIVGAGASSLSDQRHLQRLAEPHRTQNDPVTRRAIARRQSRLLDDIAVLHRTGCTRTVSPRATLLRHRRKDPSLAPPDRARVSWRWNSASRPRWCVVGWFVWTVPAPGAAPPLWARSRRLCFDSPVCFPSPRRDLVVAADGLLNSKDPDAEGAFAEHFRPEVDVRHCKFVVARRGARTFQDPHAPFTSSSSETRRSGLSVGARLSVRRPHSDLHRRMRAGHVGQKVRLRRAR